MRTFEATGNWGTLICDMITGDVVKYKREDSDWEKPGDGYDNIVRLDVEEWRTTYPDGDLTAGHDILDFGSWDAECQYCGPEEDWRFHLWHDRPDIKLSGRYRISRSIPERTPSELDQLYAGFVSFERAAAVGLRPVVPRAS